MSSKTETCGEPATRELSDDELEPVSGGVIISPRRTVPAGNFEAPADPGMEL
jgi:hypothetical protein